MGLIALFDPPKTYVAMAETGTADRADEGVDVLLSTRDRSDGPSKPSRDEDGFPYGGDQGGVHETVGTSPGRMGMGKMRSRASSFAGMTAPWSLDGSVVRESDASFSSSSSRNIDGTHTKSPPTSHRPAMGTIVVWSCLAGLILFGIGITGGILAGRAAVSDASLAHHDGTEGMNGTNPTGPDRDRYDYTAHSEYLVGVHYYPWYGHDFHNGEGYVRRDVVPRQYPSLGEYDDKDPAVIAEHMRMFRRANIGLLVTSWWGPDRPEDTTTKDVIMEHEDVGNLKIALKYETVARLGNQSDGYEQARNDIEYMCEHYFDHPNYYKVDDRPVLVVYISPRRPESVGTLEKALLTMRNQAAKCGHDIYLIGDHVLTRASDLSVPEYPFWYFDAVTNSDVTYGSAGRSSDGYAGSETVEDYYKEQATWKSQAALDNCKYIPAVSPGYNDRGVRLEVDNPALSRRLTADAEEGSLFHYQLQHAKDLADPKLDNLIFVNSFNEWHEDTQIEPVAMGDSSEWPPLMTQGLEYVGYGNLYLDILGASTVSTVGGGGIFNYLYK